VSRLRNIIAWWVLALIPATVMGDDVPTAAAMVYAKGTVSLNGSSLPNSSAILLGDVLETKSDGVATINAEGSSLIVQPESGMKLVPDGVVLDHGSISVATSKGLVAHAGGASATPSSTQWTEFEVSNINGSIEIVARKGDLAVNCGKEGTALAEGQSVTSDSTGKCGKRKKKGGAYPPAEGNILDSAYLKYIAAAAGGGVLIWVLWPRGNQPASPAIP